MGRKPDEARREELLDQIEKIILAEGFSTLHMGELAERLHCSRTTLYQLAPTKDELVLRVYNRMMVHSLDRCRLAAEACDNAVAQIRAYFDTAREAETSTSDAFWHDVMAWQPTAEARSVAHHEGMGHVKSFVEQGIREGVFRTVNAEFIAYLGWLGSLAVRDREFLSAANLSPEEAMSQLGEFIVSALTVGENETELA
jgi:AcrR family transcriptional regulator